MRAKPSRKAPLPAIGWREWVALPDLGIPEIKVKIDTGARSSALHAFDIRMFRRGERRMVRFKVHPYQRDGARTVASEAELLDLRRVRNPGGRVELRPVVRTAVELFGGRWPIELTLTNRDAMGFRMLLGRQAMRGRFLIDTGRSFLAGKAKGRRPRKSAKRRKKPT